MMRSKSLPSTSATPWMVSTNSELRRLGTIRPMIFDRFDASAPAARLGMYPADLIAERILLSVAGVTMPGFRSARDTVIADTPAIVAMSDIFAPAAAVGCLPWRGAV